MAEKKFFQIVNFAKYQGTATKRGHYNWIKLEKKLINDYNYGLLKCSEKLMFIHMLLMADQVSNRFPVDAKWMRSRLQVNAKWNFESFESKGFIEIVDTNVATLDKIRIKERCNTITPPPAPTQKTGGVRRFIFEEKDRLTAEYIQDKIKAVAPRQKISSVESMANDVRLMRIINGYSDAEIRRVFTWANHDSFWCSNILSTRKLRAQMGQLIIQMDGTVGKPPDRQNNGQPILADITFKSDKNADGSPKLVM